MKSKNRSGWRFDLKWLGYLGLVGFIGFFYEPLRLLRIACLLCIFFLFPYMKNPLFFFQILIYAFGQVVAFFRARGGFPRPGHYFQEAVFSLPFQGIWVVAHGGVDKQNSHSWQVWNQRYAYDFFIQDENKLTHKSDGKKLEDYYCFGEPILSPSAGLVVQVRDGIRDNPKLGAIDIGAKDFRGNFVTIKHASREYSHLAHLKKGSIRVKKGDRVERGQILGLCGNSGHSTEPHLHFHLQDRQNFFFALGLPLAFSNFVIRSKGQGQALKKGYISKGQEIMNES